MYVRIVTFQLDDDAAGDYQDHAAAIAPAFPSSYPGLVAKVWLADEQAGTYGGVYLFADREAADGSRNTDLFKSMVANPAFAELSVREFDVLDEPTAITASTLTPALVSD